MTAPEPVVSEAVPAWIDARSRDRLGRRRKPPTLAQLVRDRGGLAALLADGVIVEAPVTLTKREQQTADALPGWLGGEAGVDCCHPKAHREQQHPHPVTGRVICAICHPPAAELSKITTDGEPATIAPVGGQLDDGLAAQLAVIAGNESAPGFFEIRALKPAGGSVWIGVQDPDRTRKLAATVARLRVDHDVYVGAAPRVRRSGTAKDVERVWALWADCDSRESTAALLTFDPAPSVVIASGQAWHVQAYWGLREPAAPAVAQMIGQRLARLLHADNVSDPPRVLRPIGSRNSKSGEIARCLRCTSDRFTLAEILRALPAEPPNPPRTHDRPAHRRAIDGLVRATTEAREGNRNNTLHWAACRAREHVDRGELDPEAAWSALEEAALCAGLGPNEVNATLRSGLGRSG